MITQYDSQKTYGDCRQICQKFHIILYEVDIRKVSQIYLIQGGYPESFHIINSYTVQFLVQAVHFSYWWDAIVNNFRDHLPEQIDGRVVQGRPCIYS